jgi:hypothetical protein
MIPTERRLAENIVQAAGNALFLPLTADHRFENIIQQ